EGRGTVTCEVATIESSWTTDVASFLSSLTLPIAPTSPHDGRDGVYNTLTCGNHFRLTSLTWWEDAIAGWEPLDKFAEDVKSTAERLIFVLKPIRNMYDVSVFWQTEVPNDNELELIRSMTRRFEKFTLKALRAQLAENQYCYIGAFAESEAFAIQKLATETGLVTRVTFAGNAFA
ncbi:MAG TPA: hypothetical protein VHM90_15105, partial [Phycisphaerae bacterium]|nr:hypothetical protein [Phycisphaerae bacterium]